MDKKRYFVNFIKNSIVFLLGSVLSKCLTLLLLPLYTSRIPTDDMGYYDLSLTYVTIAASVLFFEIWVAILRYMYDHPEKEGQSTVMRSGMAIFLVSSLIYVFLAVVISVFFEIENFIFILIYGLLLNFSNLYSFCARGLQKNAAFAISGIINSFANIFVCVILIVCFNINYVALYIGAIVGFLLQIVYLRIAAKELNSFFFGKLDKQLAFDMLKYSIPLCLNSVAYWVVNSICRVFLNMLYGNSANGLYAVGNKFSFVIALATTCFTYAWQDLSFSQANKEGNSGKFFSVACSVYSKFLILCTIISMPLLKWIYPIMVGDSYLEAESTLPLFLISAVISAISTFIGNIFYAIKETKTIFFSTIISAFFCILIGYPLTKVLFINGANLAICLSFLLNIIIRWVILRKKIGFKIGGSFPLLLASLFVATIVYTYCNLVTNFVLIPITILVAILMFRSYIFKAIRHIKERRL